MAKSTQNYRKSYVTSDGVVTITSLTTVSVDRMVLSMVRGSAAAQHKRGVDASTPTRHDIKDLVVFPFTEA